MNLNKIIFEDDEQKKAMLKFSEDYYKQCNNNFISEEYKFAIKNIIKQLKNNDINYILFHVMELRVLIKIVTKYIPEYVPFESQEDKDNYEYNYNIVSYRDKVKHRFHMFKREYFTENEIKEIKWSE